jgi:hypothetical protein
MASTAVGASTGPNFFAIVRRSGAGPYLFILVLTIAMFFESISSEHGSSSFITVKFDGPSLMLAYLVFALLLGGWLVGLLLFPIFGSLLLEPKPRTPAGEGPKL